MAVIEFKSQIDCDLFFFKKLKAMANKCYICLLSLSKTILHPLHNAIALKCHNFPQNLSFYKLLLDKIAGNQMRNAIDN